MHGRTMKAGAILGVLALTAGCTARGGGPVAAERADAVENLRSALWTQTSVEHRAICLQAYDAAIRGMEAGLADRSWTGAAEQQALDPTDWRDLPPAVLLDVDETALDNSVYEARRIRDAQGHSLERFEAWVRESAADAVPGAVEFTKAARAKGVAVLFLTNRSTDVEPATRANLERLGFPLDSGDAVVSRGEIDTTGSADKGERRKLLSKLYRILVVAGDDLGDFLPDVRKNLAERDRMSAPFASWWGRRWIVLPNPMYGSWEDSILGVDRIKPADVRRKKKLDTLRTGPAAPVGSPN
jgi:5'-nucleotidase (lipoprotein e(P4) family)